MVFLEDGSHAFDPLGLQPSFRLRK